MTGWAQLCHSMTPQPESPLVVHVVSHTHWDREWYHPVGRFRQRLVALIDALLDEAGDDAPFLLDGQAIVLEDYLEVRPERRDILAARLRDGSLEAGPWYVLADELIPSGESLVRNLLAGRATLERLGAAAPQVLYSPDAFGHPAALPAIAAGFGMPVVVLWRGYGGAPHPRGDVARWRAPDGSTAILYHLSPDGYELGAALPVGEQDARERWAALRAVLSPRATVGEVLLPNGADHHARQPQRAHAVRTLATVASPDDVRLTSLGAFGRAIVAAAACATIPEVTGELRDSYGYTWTLQGTFATRSSLKRRAARAERALLRDTEPWAALADWMRGANRGALMRTAWKELLRCHPHDTLCGCSVDAVARAMATRLESVAAQADGLREDALLDVIRHDPVAARSAPDDWRPSLVVRNPSASPRGGVASVDVEIAREHVRVGPGSAGDSADSNPSRARGFTLGGGELSVQPLAVSQRHDRVESPQHYPWDDVVETTRAAVWVPQVAGYGTRSFEITEATPLASRAPAAIVRAGAMWMENDALRVDLDDRGIVRLATRDGARVISSLIALESVVDAGDLYTPSLRGAPRIPEHFSAALIHQGPLRGMLEVGWHFGSLSDRAVVVTLTLDAGSPFLRIDVDGTNTMTDHRLRLRIATDVAHPTVFADAAFGAIRREAILTPLGSAESAPSTAPLARYVTLATRDRGATIYSDGLGEYEAMEDGTVALTLLRAVGELSRNDLPERPGHAGWPMSTPHAQELGGFLGQFAIFLHGPRDERTIAAIERAADDVLHPLAGHTVRATLRLPDATEGVSLNGEGLALSSIKTSEDGAWMVLRCVNLTEHAVIGEWVLGGEVREARTSRLDETPGALVPMRDGRVPILAPPRGIVTMLVR
jgi:alpha-mannosidase